MSRYDRQDQPRSKRKDQPRPGRGQRTAEVQQPHQADEEPADELVAASLLPPVDELVALHLEVEELKAEVKRLEKRPTPATRRKRTPAAKKKPAAKKEPAE